MGAIRTWGPVLERTSHHSCKLDKRRKGEEIAEVRMLVATLFIKQQQQQQLAASRGKQRMHAMPESLFPGHHHHKHLFFTCEYVCMCALLYCHGYDYHSFVHMHTYSHTVLYIISGTIVFVPVVSPILPLIKCPLWHIHIRQLEYPMHCCCCCLARKQYAARSIHAKDSWSSHIDSFQSSDMVPLLLYNQFVAMHQHKHDGEEPYLLYTWE